MFSKALNFINHYLKSLIIPAVLITAFVCCYNDALAQTDDLIEIRAHERVLIEQTRYWGLNMVAVDCGDSLVIVHTLHSPVVAEKALKKIRKTFNKPVSHVIVTHHHFDHSFGNQIFKDAVIVGHEFCAVDMKAEYPDRDAAIEMYKNAISQNEQRLKDAEPGSDVAKRIESAIPFLRKALADVSESYVFTPPNLLIGKRHEMKVGDLTFRLYHMPGFHTRSFLLIHISELGIVFSRSNFLPEYLPVMETGVDMPSLIEAHEEILAGKHPLKYLIPGHNGPYTRENMDLHIDYLKAVWKAVKDAKAEGKELAEAEEVFPLDKFPNAKEFLDWHRKNLQIVWDSENTK